MLRQAATSALLLYIFFVAGSLAQKCIAQSCAIAALSGSTEESFDDIVKGMGGKQPQGSSSAGKSCIGRYYKELGIKAPASLAGSRRVAFPDDADEIGLDSDAADTKISLPSVGTSHMRIEKRQGGCKPNIMLFARGTTEPGTMGSTVGPSLSRALGAKWKSEGIRYTADIAGDNCIGFPGGVKCVAQLAKLAASCPESKFFLSGYSQGAMVARICAAFSKDDVKAKIKGVVVFGDPFNGASIKGFPKDGIKTFCNAGDGVCSGKFSITAAHLSYTVGPQIREAATWMNSRGGA